MSIINCNQSRVPEEVILHIISRYLKKIDRKFNQEFCNYFELNLTKEMAEYCVARMKPYVEPKTERPIPNALDYIHFTRTLFQN